MGSPQIIEFPSASTATDISRTESVYVQTKFIDSVRVGHDQLDDVLKMMKVKRLTFGTTQQIPRGMESNLIFFVFTNPNLDLTSMLYLLDRDDVGLPEVSGGTHTVT